LVKLAAVGEHVGQGVAIDPQQRITGFYPSQGGGRVGGDTFNQGRVDRDRWRRLEQGQIG
jgi:hypothetical protein